MAPIYVLLFTGLLLNADVLAAPSSKLYTDKVVNGQDAVPGSHPHQVTVQWAFFGSWYHICGGSVINDLFVLTAAHCVDFAPPAEFRVVVNDHNIYDYDGPEQDILVKRIYLHENWIGTIDYDLKVFPNDIAILMLETEVDDKSTIISMATDPDEDFAGTLCTISGWGINVYDYSADCTFTPWSLNFKPTANIWRDSQPQYRYETLTDTDGMVPNTLQEVNMTVMAQANCSDFWTQLWPDDIIDLFMGQICIFGGEDPVQGASACSGDSGGPMVCNGLLAGVTSWGVQGCRDADTQEFRPSVYVRVSYYYPWIQTVLGRFSVGRG